MEQLFGQNELTIEPILTQLELMVIGSYEGSTDQVSDKAAADAVLAALFPNRWQESGVMNVSALTFTLTKGAFDSRIVPLVYQGGILMDPSLYSFVPGTGVFTFLSLPTGPITVTLVKNIFGAMAPDLTSDFPNKNLDITGLGAIDPIYSGIQFDPLKSGVKVKGTFDIRVTRRDNPTCDLEMAIYGDQWVPNSDNRMIRNSNPFFIAWIYWNPDAAAGELQVKKVVHYGCILNKGVYPIPKDDGKPSEFEIDAISLYSDVIDTIAT
jgi:hypothetical protein